MRITAGTVIVLCVIVLALFPGLVDQLGVPRTFAWLIALAAIGVYWKKRQAPPKQENTPNKGTIEIAPDINLTWEVSCREKTPSEEKSSELLREATRRKENKDLDGAIECLREAYALMEQSDLSHTIETYLRLPLYLQQAGHYKESILEFEKLLTNAPNAIAREFGHLTKQEQGYFSAMRLATIYDKMRLASQREKYFSHAVCYQVLSKAIRATSWQLKDEKEHVSRFQEPEIWFNGLEALLKKGKKEAFAQDIVDKALEFSRSCTQEAFQKLAADIAELLEIPLEELCIIKNTDVPAQIYEEPYDNDDHLQWLEDSVRHHIFQARDAWNDGNYDFARQEYQKTAYAMTQMDGQEWAKEKLKEEQARFARNDPLYQEIMPIIQKKVGENPGVLQTSIYGTIPFQKDDIIYALYFGALLNDIRREKKGRTYTLFLPDDDLIKLPE